MNRLLVSAAAGVLLLFAGTASAQAPIAIAGAEAAASALASQGQGQQQSGNVTNKSGDSRALGVALGQAATAAQGCMKGTKFLFGLLEWTDYSSKCANYEAAAFADAAAAGAPDVETRNYYYIRANELTARAEE